MGSKLILLAAAIALSTRFIEDFMKTADGVELYTLAVAPAGAGTCPIVICCATT